MAPMEHRDHPPLHLLPAPLRLLCARAGDEHRHALAALVRDVYAAAYGARVRHFHELLLGLADGEGRLLGAIGATETRSQEPLFLEAYLDEPVQVLLSRALGRTVGREQLVEVGNLSATRPGLGAALLSTLAVHLRARARAFAVFTATAALRRTFARLAVPVHDLAAADGRRLGAALADWGTYYDTDPRVVAVDVAATCEAALGHPELALPLAPVWADAAARGAGTGVRRTRASA